MGEGKQTMEEEWAAQEFAEVELGDPRRKKRLIQVAQQRAKRTNASIAASCGNWAATKAAYRLLDNEAVGAEAILEGHYQASIERARAEAIVLAVQDTTVLNYSQHPATEGLGYLQDLQMQGLLVHSTLLISPQRVPLGLIDQQVWVRDPAEYGQPKSTQRPSEAKESQKWTVSLLATERAQGQVGTTRLINVGDSEADVYGLFHQAQQVRQELLVRAAYDRRVEHPQGHLWAYLGQQAPAGEVQLEIAGNGEHPPRQARLVVRFAPLSLRPPDYAQKKQWEPLALWGVLAREIDPPAGEEAVEWLLIANFPITTLQEATTCLNWYSCRWGIETYHKVLKSGCRVEQRQFGDVDNLQRYLALDAVVAWRVLYLTMLARAAPDLPCTAVLEPHEWQALYAFHHRTPRLPDPLPSLRQTVGWIAQLGGFLARKSDGDPGPMSLWRGLQRLADIADTWLLFHDP